MLFLKRTVVLPAALLIAGAVMVAPPAAAEIVNVIPADAITLYESTVMVRGASRTTNSIDLDGPGTLYVGLRDLEWPDEPFSQLMLGLMSATTLLDSFSGSNILAYEVTSQTQLFANIFAVGSTATNTGIYSLRIAFAPLAPVPLPAAGLLLLSGLALLAGARRRPGQVAGAAA